MSWIVSEFCKDAFFVFSRRDPNLLFKGAAKILCGREAALQSAILDGKKGILHQLSCVVQPYRNEIFCGRCMVLFLKKLSEIYLADACLLGEKCDAERSLAVMTVDIELGGIYAVILVFRSHSLLRTLKKCAVNAI